MEKVLNLFSVWTGKKRNEAIYDEAAEYIDYGAMAERALGSTWESLNEKQRKEFVVMLRRLIEERYYPRWHKIFSKGKVKLIKEVPARDELFVNTELVVGKKRDKLIWHMARAGGGLKIISLAVDDKDLLTRLGLRLKKQIKKEGFEKLLDWMKDESDLDEDDEA